MQLNLYLQPVKVKLCHCLKTGAAKYSHRESTNNTRLCVRLQRIPVVTTHLHMLSSAHPLVCVRVTSSLAFVLFWGD